MPLGPLFLLAALVVATPGDSIRARYLALDKEYDVKMEAFSAAMQGTGDAAKQAEIERTLRPDDADYAARFFALAHEEPTSPTAPDALYSVLLLQSNRLTALGHEAFDRLARDYRTSPRMGDFLQRLASHPWPGMEQLLRDVLDHNPDRTARGMACHGLAGMMAEYAETPKYCLDPELAAQLARERGPEVMAAILRRDSAADLVEAVALHERVVSEFADVPLFPAYPKDRRTLGPLAQSWLANQLELGIGKVAPEIEGHDADGRAFKLSDYRGKVVVVVFWASWCGPCMSQVPHERELLTQMAGKPFALLGVNCDHKLADARKAMAQERMTWPNWYDSNPNDKLQIEGPICDKYHIQSLPAVFVIDPDGVIRGKDLRGVELVRAVEEQLQKAKR